MDFDKMKVAELKEELESRGLDTSGKKADLIARLKADEAGSEEAAAPMAVEPASTKRKKGAASAADEPAEVVKKVKGSDGGAAKKKFNVPVDKDCRLFGRAEVG